MKPHTTIPIKALTSDGRILIYDLLRVRPKDVVQTGLAGLVPLGDYGQPLA